MLCYVIQQFSRHPLVCLSHLATATATAMGLIIIIIIILFALYYNSMQVYIDTVLEEQDSKVRQEH